MPKLTRADAERIILGGRMRDHLSAGEAEYLDLHLGRYLTTLKCLPPAAGGRLLDVGCFPGHLALLAAAEGWQVAGFSSPGARCGDPGFEERMARAGIEVRTGDAERDALPFGGAEFDAVFFNETIEHLPFNPFHALDQIWRVLKPGARLVLSVPNLASFDHRWALLKGRTIYPLLTEPLSRSFHADLSQRHIREYTPGEVRYLLDGQEKYLYRFAPSRLVMDRSWDGLFCTAAGTRVQWSGVRPGRVLREVVTRLAPGTRANIIALAQKPADYVRVAGGSIRGAGWLAPEPTGTSDAFVRRPVAAQWMGREALVELELPEKTRPAAWVDLLALLPGPEALPARAVEVRVNGRATGALRVSPSNEPRRVRVAVPPDAAAGARGRLRLELRTDPWRPSDYGAADARGLGVMLVLDEVAVQYRG